MALAYVGTADISSILAGQVALASSQHPASTAAALFVFETLGLLTPVGRLPLAMAATASTQLVLDDMMTGDVLELLALAVAELGAAS